VGGAKGQPRELFMTAWYSRHEKKVAMPWLGVFHDFAWLAHEQIETLDFRQLVLTFLFFYVYDCGAIANNWLTRAHGLVVSMRRQCDDDDA
jgi:hypothetical protein